MVKFKTVTLRDKAWVDEIVMAENSPSADYNFGNIYIWDKHYRQLICPLGGRMLTKLRYEGKPTFVFPIGTGPLRPAIEAVTGIKLGPARSPLAPATEEEMNLTLGILKEIGKLN